ncbi:MAG: helix-turn-helix transcriptional regulator [Clostridia bacterium]|nr:helix-turn-helix transcriptional regulator [Clostridia bacterium]
MLMFVMKEKRMDARLSLNRLSKMTGLNEKFLFELENNYIESVSYVELELIARVLNVKVRELYYTMGDYEVLRRKLYISIDEKGINSVEVRKISILIDELFNNMNR